MGSSTPSLLTIGRSLGETGRLKRESIFDDRGGRNEVKGSRNILVGGHIGGRDDYPIFVYSKTGSFGYSAKENSGNGASTHNQRRRKETKERKAESIRFF